jgi:hypothetical protein
MTDQAAGCDAGDRALLSDSQGSERQKRRRVESQRADADVVWLMNQREGRRFVWRLLQLCHLYETSFTGPGSSKGATFFREGERNVGLQVLADIVRLCPELHARMAGESPARGAGSRTVEEN